MSEHINGLPPAIRQSAHGCAPALAAAIALGKQGYTCFPCLLNKRPACPHSFYDGSTDAADLTVLWKQHPGELVGVATGIASHIAVLDLDKKHPEAMRWWFEHRPRLLPTRAHRTRTGGIHLIYGLDDDLLRNSESKIEKGVDVRANGGYVIWWPATGCPVLAGAPIAPWPEWLDEALTAAAPVATAPPAPMRITWAMREGGDVAVRLKGLLKFVYGAVEGQRNASIYWAACRITDMIRHGEIDRNQGLRAFNALHDAGIHIGLTSQEIIRTFHSAANGKAA